ncbi:MAG: hypothetical protein ACI9XO_000728 [Paraglaciecola sp.]|jgi:hypothetical protein
MKQTLLFTFLMMIGSFSNLFGQSSTLQKSSNLWVAQPMQPAILDLGEEPNLSNHTLDVPQNAVSSRTDTEILIGTTVYDLQTNGSMASRIVTHANGTLSAIWTRGMEAASGYPMRGTGYNYFDGDSWGEDPTARLEESLRTGWPSIGSTADDNEVIINHVFQAPLQLHQLTNSIGGTAWSEMNVPNGTPAGVVWPRMAVGGDDGNSVHVIAITAPVVNDGTVYEGIDGHILYYRSTDGGATYDIQDMIIPGLDNTALVSGSADSYAIDAHGETVVVAHFGAFADVDVFKSLDNGETWTEMTVHDFPLDNYMIDSGYTVDDLPPYDSLISPSPLAILTSDQSGAVIIDNNDMVHAFFGQMYVQDEDLTDDGTTYFPATSGIAYWNESFGEDSIQVIADAEDVNGNGVLDIASIDNIALYFNSLTSYPSVGVDADNNLHLVYSAVMENFINDNANPNAQHNRHIYRMVRSSGGDWTTPEDLITEETVVEPDLFPAIETVFPSIARNVIGEGQIIYQVDFEPGLSVQGDMDETNVNFIAFIGTLPTVINTFENTSVTDWQISPNPTTDLVNLKIEINATAEVQMTVFNLMGQAVSFEIFGKQPAGTFNETINMDKFPKGAYFVKIDVDGAMLSKKLLKN